MINRNSLKSFKKFDSGKLFKPNYQNYSFANIPSTIYYLLTGEKCGNLLPVDCFGKEYPRAQKIVLFFIDAFGFKAWEKYYKRFEITQKIVNEGILTPISALFPSATGPSTTTINTSVLPLVHGLLEWYLYIKEYDDVIMSLPFSPLGNNSMDGCLKLGYDPQYLLISEGTFYEKLKGKGVSSYQYYKKDYFDSTYNRFASRGAKINSYSSFEQAFNDIKELISEEEKTFINFYTEVLDSASHAEGPDSSRFDDEASKFWSAFSEAFMNYKKEDDVLFLFIADHGQIGIDPEKTYYLNKEIPQFKDYLKLRKNGEIIYPTGACRDVMLHIKEEAVSDVIRLLEQKLKGIAKVMLSSEAVKMGLFGLPPYNERAVERLGQILILPYKNNCVWWYEEGKLKVDHFGMHGGLSEEEMLTVFGVW